MGWLIWQTLKLAILVPTLLVILTGLIVAGYSAYYIYYWDKKDLPDINKLLRLSPPAITEVIDTNGQLLAELATEYRKPITYSDIPKIVEWAILAAEDKRFWRHDGKDSMAILRAGWEIVKASIDKSRRVKKPRLIFVQGGSTVDQQLIKLVFPDVKKEEIDPSITGWRKNWSKAKRKLKEIKLAVWMEKEFVKIYGSKQKAKEEILTRFMNMVYLDFGRYGFASAAEYYFGKSVREFTTGDVEKAAMLAAIIKSPTEFSPLRKQNLTSKRAVSRRNAIIDLMAEEKFLTREEAERSKQKPIETAERQTVKTIAPAAINHMFDALPGFGFDFKKIFEEGNIQIRLTIDEDIQNAANEALEKGLRAYGERHPENAEKVQGAVVVLRNQDGAILAEVGGRFFKKEGAASYTELNRATQTQRQPGSAFKPFTFLTALEDDWGLDCKQGKKCRILDTKNTCLPMGRGRPRHCIKNYDGKYKGVITPRQALAESRNAATMQLARSLGIKNVIAAAHRIGIKSQLQPYPTTALGASEVTLMELTNAFRTIASGGILVEPYIVEEIKTPAESVTVSRGEEKRAIEEKIAIWMQEALRGTIRLPNGTGSSLDNTAAWRKNKFPFPVCGKTGTTSDFKDAWFIGCTAGPDGITIGVWIGIDDGTPLFDEEKCKTEARKDCNSSREPGGKTALPVFRELLLAIYKDVKPDNFPDEIEKNIDDYLGRKHEPVSYETTDESNEQIEEEQLKAPNHGAV